MHRQSLGAEARHILKLNKMTETEAINFATLHLEGEAHDWWHHGLVKLGQSHITSYRVHRETHGQV